MCQSLGRRAESNEYKRKSHGALGPTGYSDIHAIPLCAHHSRGSKAEFRSSTPMPQTLLLTCLAWTFRRDADDLAEMLRDYLR